MNRKTTAFILSLALATLVLAACAPGANELVNTASSRGSPAGFWLGLWHGCIAPITFIVSLFKDSLNIYELHNNGGWYNFGFLLGTCISLGGGARGASRRERAPREKKAGGKAEAQAIQDFLAQRRLALVGLSRDQADFSRGLFRELRRRGYDMVPVNPAQQEVEGLRCYARVQDIQPPVDGALIMTPPAQTEAVVRDCLEAGVRRIWLHRATGQGAVSQAALDLCAGEGVQVVAGECPYMFLPNAGGVHRLHGFLRRLGGSRGELSGPAA
jgi:predicted CoA-binding protein